MSTCEWGSRWSERARTVFSASTCETGASLPTVIVTASGPSVLGPAASSTVVYPGCVSATTAAPRLTSMRTASGSRAVLISTRIARSPVANTASSERARTNVCTGSWGPR